VRRAVDFFNEVSLIYGVVAEDACRYPNAGEGFPPNFEYRWAEDGNKTKPPLRVSSPQYVALAMNWVEGQISNPKLFPIEEAPAFLPGFKVIVRQILKRLFRVYAIIFNAHYEAIENVGAQAHLNLCFKHFMYFVYFYDLVDARELKALGGPTSLVLEEFKQEQAVLKGAK
jgi:MOB kinase activator 1